MRIRIGILAAGLLGLGAVPAAACSCRCTDAATLAREVPLFFRGTPVAEAVEGAKRRYVFEVSAVHKGTTAARTVVGTPVHAAACGVRFPLNQEALVGAFPAEGEVHANQCTQFCIGQRREELERILSRCAPGAPCPPDS